RLVLRQAPPFGGDEPRQSGRRRATAPGDGGSMTTTTHTQQRRTRVRRRWTDWIGYAAAAWAAGYATLALIWTVTGEGFPFGTGNPESIGLLRGLPADVGAPLFA